MENKPFLYRFIGHFNTITKHKLLVTSLCFKCGLYKQGLLHDLSKYSLQEFIPGVKYYQGYRSPISAEKIAIGYSKAYLHHKGRNKHHWEFWIDRLPMSTQLVTLEMPFNYVIECVLDKIAASKVYMKDKYTIDYPLSFFKNSKEYEVMNPINVHQLEVLLSYLEKNGEEKALKYYKSLYKQYKSNKSITL